MSFFVEIPAILVDWNICDVVTSCVFRFRLLCRFLLLLLLLWIGNAVMVFVDVVFAYAHCFVMTRNQTKPPKLLNKKNKNKTKYPEGC